jgi:UDP-3-O-[3-hydroxymyristoyl] N-acetylglucosamine deacetylase
MAVAVVAQRTLKNPISCTGIGVHSGMRVRMVLHPAPADHGIVFRRSDLARRGGETEIRADWRSVVDSRLCTTIGNDAGVKVATVEHLMAAFYGCEIDNALVEISGPELPIMDGSAAPFVFLIECAGTMELEEPRRAIQVLRPIAVEDGSRRAVLKPGAGLTISCEIDFDSSLVARQRFTHDLEPVTFRSEISRARTFGFAADIDRLRAAGLARGGSLDNAVVIGKDRILNAEGLRFADEFVRHKVLDCVGDLYLAGAPILGHLDAVRVGHALNYRLLRTLFERQDAWRMVEMTTAFPVARQGARMREALRAAGD